jgi:hypothetical protein
MVNGKLEYMIGRPIDMEGSHCSGARNHDSLSICVLGNWDVNIPTYDHYFYTASLCRALMLKCKAIELMDIQGHWCHNNYKSCPGENFNFIKLRKVITG